MQRRLLTLRRIACTAGQTWARWSVNCGTNCMPWRTLWRRRQQIWCRWLVPVCHWIWGRASGNSINIRSRKLFQLKSNLLNLLKYTLSVMTSRKLPENRKTFQASQIWRQTKRWFKNQNSGWTQKWKVAASHRALCRIVACLALSTTTLAQQWSSTSVLWPCSCVAAWAGA